MANGSKKVDKHLVDVMDMMVSLLGLCIGHGCMWWEIDGFAW